jgi:hypothetical protein
MRFASDSLLNNGEPAGGGGRYGLDRLASQELKQISINLALSLRGAPCATNQSRRWSTSRPEIASPWAKPAGRNDDRK